MERLGFKRRDRKQLKRCEHAHYDIVPEFGYSTATFSCRGCGNKVVLTSEQVKASPYSAVAMVARRFKAIKGVSHSAL